MPISYDPPMRHFDPENGWLKVGSTTLDKLIARVGQGPFYAYDSNLIAARIRQVRQVFPKKIQLHYAIKANPMPALVGFVSPLVDGFDVASAGEMTLALNARMANEKVSFAGPGKTAAELRQAAAAGVIIHVESLREIEILDRISSETKWPVRVAIRVNPSFELRGAGMKMSGGPKPFGIDQELVPEVIERIRTTDLQFVGFHFFAGSQNLSSEAIVDSQNKIGEAAIDLLARSETRASHGASFANDFVYLNLGGGLGIPYFDSDQPVDLKSIGDNLAKLMASLRGRFPRLHLVVELGRYLVGEAGIYVTEILDRKISRGRQFIVVNGGLHHHLAASGNFGQIIRRNFHVSLGRLGSSETETATVVGPLCTPLDILADQVTLPKSTVGDFFVVYQSGAYGRSASPQDFLSHPHVLEILL